MNISKKILRAINEGVMYALVDYDDIAVNKVLNNSIDNTFKTNLYTQQLQEMLPNANNIYDISKHNACNFVTTAIELHEKYGVTYNPHLDGLDFKKFVRACLQCLPKNILKKVSLNWIDTSDVTDMYELFGKEIKFAPDTQLTLFNGDISEWDVSNVIDMHSMFINSRFNGNISNWNVSHVEDMGGMFLNSRFNGNISNWNVSNVKYMNFMFCNSIFNKNISNWNVSNVTNMNSMFRNSEFNLDIHEWNISNVIHMYGMFSLCYKFNLNLSNWDVSNINKDKKLMFYGCISLQKEYWPKGA